MCSYFIIPFPVVHKDNFMKFCSEVHLDSDTKVLPIQGAPRTLIVNNSLFIRRAYQQLYNLMFTTYRHEDIIILGSPGIGKTVFLTYILIRAIKEQKHEVIIFCKHSEDKIVYFDTNNLGYKIVNISDVEHLLVSGEALLLIDAAASTTQSYTVGRCRVIVASSPNIINYKDLLKDCQPVELHMPVWTFEEIISAYTEIPEYKSCLCEGKIKARYARFGGIPRVLFANDSYYRTAEKQQEHAINNCAPRTLFNQFSRVDTDRTSHYIFHQVVKDDGTYKNFAMLFASQYISDKVCNNIASESEELKWVMHSARSVPILGSFRGYLFEAFVFTGMFAESNNEYNVFDLSTKEEQFFNIEKKSQFTFDKLDEVQNSLEPEQISSALLVPYNRSNPTWYSIAPPDSIFQVTVSLKHDLKESGLRASVDFLDKINKPNKSKTYYFYWVVPFENLSIFKPPLMDKTQYPIMSRVKQYVIRYKSLFPD